MFQNIFSKTLFSTASCIRTLRNTTVCDYLTKCQAISRSSLGVHSVRWQSTGDGKDQQPLSENDVVSPKFINRNPRNLEMMNLARKPKGWRFQFPSHYFYHRLVFSSSVHNTEAYVEHSSGKHIIAASTKERAISKYLHSKRDVSAAENIGRVIAQRCKESGITSMALYIPPSKNFSEKFLAFHQAVVDSGINLKEPDLVRQDYEPGIDYDNEEEVANLMERQKRVLKRGPEAAKHMFLKVARRRGKTTPIMYKNINRNRGYTTHGRLLGYHMIHHRHMK